MARIVFTTWGSLGDLHPFLALAIEMQRRGHSATLATLGAWREIVEGAGVGFRPIRPDITPQDPISREVVQKILDPMRGAEYLFRDLFGPRIREVYDDTLAAVRGADLLVSHQLPPVASIIVEQTGIAWVSAILAPLGFLSAYDPPTQAQAPFARSLVALHPLMGRLVNQVGRVVTNRWLQPVYRLRAELGLPPGGHPLFEGQHSPARVLALFSRLLSEKQPDFPPQTVVTGFPFYDAAAARPVDPALLAFLEAGEPPIVFTLGSSAVWIAGDFYPVSVAAVRALGRRALLLVGENAQAMRADLPDTIGVFDYAPHALVMSRASVIVHQGGVGTTGQALRAGRPVLVVPFGQDQFDNGRRVAALGVGRTMTRRHYRVDRVIQELSVLASPDYGHRAQEVGLAIAAEHGVETACDAIEAELQK
ncbi:MAG: rhamnosyltransferase subunit [Acidobacteriota bacterium]|jgi:UDP:flavonoid glycosyltransferase YjiC (YdhE family)